MQLVKRGKGIFTYTSEGLELDRKISNAIHSIVKEYTEKGYDLLEIDYVITSITGCILAEERIRYNIKERKKLAKSRIEKLEEI